MELALSISHRCQVWIRGRIEESSRNREKERKRSLAERGKERKLFAEDRVSVKPFKCVKKLLKRGRKRFSFCLVARRRFHECKPNRRETDAGKWFLGEVVDVPLLEAP